MLDRRASVARERRSGVLPIVPLFVLAAMLALAGCGRIVDADQARLCRQTLPAIEREGLPVVERIAPGPGESDVEVVYRVDAAGVVRRARVLCTFGGGLLSPGRLDLAELTHDGIRLPGASLVFLKRFWLERPESALADPGSAESALAGLPQVPRWLAVAMQHGLAGMPITAIYLLLAPAYALVYGLIGRINLAFGEFAALGAAGAAIGLVAAGGLGVAAAAGLAIAALLAALLMTVAHGAVATRLVFVPLANRRGQHVLVATVGLSILLQEYMRLSQGASVRWMPPFWNEPLHLARSGSFVVTTTTIGIGLILLAAVAGGALLVMLRFTRFGRDWRAVADDAGAAELFGVSRTRTIGRTLALASALAGLAGVVVTLHYGGLGFAGGTVLGLKALVAAIAGGIGSVRGALLGALLLGAAETTWSALLPIEMREIAVFGLLSLLLTIRPGGLFGFGDLAPRRV